MDMHIWWTFLLGTIVICGSPGPNMLQVMVSGARYGFRQAFFAMAGCFLPVFMFSCISLAGMGTLLKTFPALFDLLCYAGAAYLIYLGIAAWRAPLADIEKEAGWISVDRSPKTIFLRSFIVGISNPKALLFATAYFPQFLNPDAPQAIQFIILLGTFSIVEISWYMIYALGGSRLTAAMRQAGMRRLFNRLTGTLFAGFGFLLMVKER